MPTHAAGRMVWTPGVCPDFLVGRGGAGGPVLTISRGQERRGQKDEVLTESKHRKSDEHHQRSHPGRVATHTIT